MLMCGISSCFIFVSIQINIKDPTDSRSLYRNITVTVHLSHAALHELNADLSTLFMVICLQYESDFDFFFFFKKGAGSAQPQHSHAQPRTATQQQQQSYLCSPSLCLCTLRSVGNKTPEPPAGRAAGTAGRRTPGTGQPRRDTSQRLTPL